MMLLSHKQLSMLRIGLVLLATSVVTLCYYSFSHFVYHRRHFNHEQHNGTHRSPSTDIYMKEDRLSFYHLARPLALVTLVSAWNLSTSNTNDSSITSTDAFFSSFWIVPFVDFESIWLVSLLLPPLILIARP